jgi:tRNA(adenine34) deaminase
MAGSVFDAFALPANHRVEVIGGLLEQPCGDLLRDFFARRRRNYDKLEHEV